MGTSIPVIGACGQFADPEVGYTRVHKPDTPLHRMTRMLPKQAVHLLGTCKLHRCKVLRRLSNSCIAFVAQQFSSLG